MSESSKRKSDSKFSKEWTQPKKSPPSTPSPSSASSFENSAFSWPQPSQHFSLGNNSQYVTWLSTLLYGSGQFARVKCTQGFLHLCLDLWYLEVLGTRFFSARTSEERLIRGQSKITRLELCLRWHSWRFRVGLLQWSLCLSCMISRRRFKIRELCMRRCWNRRRCSTTRRRYHFEMCIPGIWRTVVLRFQGLWRWCPVRTERSRIFWVFCSTQIW